MKKALKLKVSKFELVWYILTGAVGVWGLTYIVLGLVAMYAPVSLHDNVMLEASDKIKDAFGLGFFGWGLIIFAVAAVAASTCLVIASKSVDREAEKSARRAARLGTVTKETKE